MRIIRACPNGIRRSTISNDPMVLPRYFFFIVVEYFYFTVAKLSIISEL